MNIFEHSYSWRSLATWIGSTLFASALFWAVFSMCVSGCVDMPMPDPEPQARIVVAWDPLVCGEPHRVVIELEDNDGAKLSRSVPCGAGGITIDVPRWGVYRGRIYAWTLGPEIRSVMQVRVDVDAPVIYWNVETPR
jgi:hypothetical protein